jgi:hypothetical protein
MVPFTKQLPPTLARQQDIKDVKQNIARVFKAIVLSPKHLVDQVLTGHANWIDPSNHEDRMAQRVANGDFATYGAYQADLANKRLALNEKISAAAGFPPVLLGKEGCQDERLAAKLQSQADAAMLDLLQQGHIAVEDYVRFREGHDGRPYVQLPWLQQALCLPFEPRVKAALCQATIGQRFIDANWAEHQEGLANEYSVPNSEPNLKFTIEDVQAWMDTDPYQ